MSDASSSGGLNRRRFLEQSALAGAAAGLVFAPRGVHAQASGDGPETSRKIVVGVMGLSRGRSLATTFARRPGVEVKYVCDVDSERAASCVKLLEGTGVPRPAQPITDFRRILDDKEVDALVCAAPNHWHAPATILGCVAGKHVYVEKPCSHNPWEGETMVQAARKYNRAVQVGTQRRSSDGTAAAVKALRDGVIGRVYLARSWYTNLRGSIGHGQVAEVPSQLDYELWQGPAPRQPYLDNVVHYNWHWRWHWGNGELGNNGVHTLDLCRWGMGVDFPTRVTSSGGRYHYQDDQETPDTHTVCFEFPGRQSITWEGLSCNRHGGGFCTFYGEEGALELDSNGTFIVYDRQDKKVSENRGTTRGDTEHVDNFLAAIRSEDPASLNAEIAEGHKSTLLCHLGNIAQRTGRTLNCDPENGRIQNDAEAMELWKREYAPNWEPKLS